MKCLLQRGVIDMKAYEKMLIAIHEKDLNCFAEKGDWLYIASQKDSKKKLFRLSSYLHYFVSIDDKRMPSELGVVRKITPPITAYELAELDYRSRKKDISEISDKAVQEYEVFLEKINAQPINTPICVTWLDKTFPTKERVLRVHKKFFTGWTKEERAEVFENE